MYVVQNSKKLTNKFDEWSNFHQIGQFFNHLKFCAIRYMIIVHNTASENVARRGKLQHFNVGYTGHIHNYDLLCHLGTFIKVIVQKRWPSD